jgi:hypothetical protein
MCHRGRVRILYCAVLLGVGCADAVQPRGIQGRYVLETVNGDAAPWVIAVVPPEVVRLTSGVIHLRADSTFTDTTVIEYDAQPFGGIETETQVRNGTWPADESFARDGDTIERVEKRRLPLMDLTLRYRRH